MGGGEQLSDSQMDIIKVLFSAPHSAMVSCSLIPFHSKINASQGSFLEKTKPSTNLYYQTNKVGIRKIWKQVPDALAWYMHGLPLS